MRQDKLTTKLQEALADAQSLAVGNDNQYIEPVHLLAALLGQSDGGARSLLQRAGVNVGGLQAALRTAFDRLPKVSGTGGDVLYRERTFFGVNEVTAIQNGDWHVLTHGTTTHGVQAVRGKVRPAEVRTKPLYRKENDG